jgi:hypothetical protein
LWIRVRKKNEKYYQNAPTSTFARHGVENFADLSVSARERTRKIKNISVKRTKIADICRRQAGRILMEKVHCV